MTTKTITEAQLAEAIQALLDGPRQVQIVENDVEGMGRLIWAPEAAAAIFAVLPDGAPDGFTDPYSEGYAAGLGGLDVERLAAAEACLVWYDTTHGNEFGHDHHCEAARWESPGELTRADGSTFPRTSMQVETGKLCTCGWGAFAAEYARLTSPTAEGES